MKRARLVLAGLSLCSALLAGCDEVGAPLLDRTPPVEKPEIPTVKCTLPPACDGPARSSDTHPRVDVRPIDLAACGAAKTRTCVLRETADTVEVGTSDPDVDLDVDSDAGVEPGSPLAACTPQLGLGAAGAECETLELLAQGGEHIVTGLTLRNVNLSVRASQPTTLTLEDATLDAVFLELQGPITLRMHAARRVDTLRVVTSASAEGEPRVELLNVDASRLQMGSVESAFEGALRFDQVELQDAQLLAERIELQSFALDGGRIEAQQLTATDVQLSSATLALGNAVLSASALTGATFESCDTLVLIASRVRVSTLVPCTGPPVRVYATSVIASKADGRFESDLSLWEGVAFGASADTQLVAFSGTVRSVNFCAAASGPMLGGGLSLSCSKCDGWSPGTTPPCRIAEDAQLGVNPNFCSLLDVTMFALCPEPEPERDRPLERPF